VRKTTNQNKEEKPMSIQIPESNKKQFNELAEKIIDELAKVFPAGIAVNNHHSAFKGVNNAYANNVLNFLVHSGYLFKVEQCYYLTEKSLNALSSDGSFSAIAR